MYIFLPLKLIIIGTLVFPPYWVLRTKTSLSLKGAVVVSIVVELVVEVVVDAEVVVVLVAIA